jgi:hypothetical protein
MPRNKYTKAIRKDERARIAQQEKELESLTRELRRAVSENAVVVPANEMKVRRSARLEQKRLHKPISHVAVAAIS